MHLGERFWKKTTNTTTTVLRPLDFVRDYPGERVPEDKTRKDLLEQEKLSGSGISWAICKSAPDR